MSYRTVACSAALLSSSILITGCWQIAMMPLEIDNHNPLNYRTLHIRVVDAQTGAPVEGARIWTTYDEWGVKSHSAISGADGEAKLRAWKWHEELAVVAPGYARGVTDRIEEKDGYRNLVTLVLSRPVLVGVELVVPDGWEGQIVVGEYVGSPEKWPADAPDWDPCLQFSPARVTLRALRWVPPTGPPPLIEIWPSYELRDRAHPPEVYRVLGARTESGTLIPVYRDATPPSGAVGLYYLGRATECDEYGYGASHFMLGTLSKARIAAQSCGIAQWCPNAHLVRW